MPPQSVYYLALSGASSLSVLPGTVRCHLTQCITWHCPVPPHSVYYLALSSATSLSVLPGTVQCHLLQCVTWHCPVASHCSDTEPIGSHSHGWQPFNEKPKCCGSHTSHFWLVTPAQRGFGLVYNLCLFVLTKTTNWSFRRRVLQIWWGLRSPGLKRIVWRLGYRGSPFLQLHWPVWVSHVVLYEPTTSQAQSSHPCT